jgi:hypothetical protein
MDLTSQSTVKDKKNSLQFDRLLPAIIHPKRTFTQIIEDDKPVWLTPLLVVSALILVAGLIAGPIRRDAIVNGTTLGSDFQYYSADQQQQILAAQATRSSALFTFVFPIVGSLLGLWVTWFLLSSILHLGLTLAGSRTRNLHSYNLVAWSMLPIAFRQIIQIFAMIFAHALISSPGLSGFVTGTGGAAFLAGWLGQVDLFFIWQVCLLMIGVLPLSKLSRGKAWMVTGASILLVMLLAAFPKLISSMLANVSLGGFF